MYRYAIVRKALPDIGHFEYAVFCDGRMIAEPQKSRDGAVLLVFELSGWTGDYTIRFCDNEEVYHSTA